MKKSLPLALSLLFVMLVAATAHADLLEENLLANRTFDSNLSSWSYQGDVKWSNGTALLGSNHRSGTSSISQSFYIKPGTTSLDVSFDLTFSGFDRDRFANDTASVILSTLQMESWWIFERESWTEQIIKEWTSGSNTYTSIHFSGTILLGEYDDLPNNGKISFVLDQSKKGGSHASLCTSMAVDNVLITRPSDSPTPAPTPEPGTVMLMGSGLAGLALCMRRRGK